MRLWCVVPAAGKGLRMGAACPKQYLLLLGKTVFYRTLERLSQIPEVTGFRIAVSAQDERAALELPSDHRMILVTGGEERCQSVQAALISLRDEADDQDWVLVHDVARPCVRLNDIYRLMESCQEPAAEGGLLATPIADTLKRASQVQQVAATVDRRDLWAALTPQMFRYGPLLRSLNEAIASGLIVSDESSAMEAQGYHPRLVQGARDNIKITLPEDLSWAEGILMMQQGVSS